MDTIQQIKKTLYIDNNISAHYEIIESIIVKYKCIIGNMNIQTICLKFKPNLEFKDYIMKKYPNVKFGKPMRYHYYIGVTLYPEEYITISKKDRTTHFYISHRVDDVFNGAKNIFYLSPLSTYNVFQADVLPFSKEKNQKQNAIPIYIVQGDIQKRNLRLLEKILETEYPHDYRIKIVGKGTVPPQFEKYDKLILCKNYGWEQYHKEFLDCYCIIPLILKDTHIHYYTHTLTSTINYARGYELKCLIDADLQNIYNLKDVELFNDETDICKAFEQTLVDFYNA